uniref:Small ribosomal subunit protein eS4 n=1 Tax=Oryctolagus cuniculus TaxID=9986 RepID=A0A5F9DVM8_RABIT
MARGPKKHLKRVTAPKHWMLDKLTSVFAPRPSTGPHKLRECLPLIIFLRNRLKYALTGDEVKKICMQRFIKIDGKVRTDITYPAGFMDVISVDKTGENFRLIYDTKGRFAVHRSPTFSLLARATNHGFPFLEERGSASPLLKRETRDWLPNRAVGEMLSL